MARVSFAFFCIIHPILNAFGQNAAGSWENPMEDGRIVNGTKAIPRQFPYQVSLRRSYSAAFFCGGSLIAPSFVLTAAHCMFIADGEAEVAPQRVDVVAGEIKLFGEKPNPDHVRRVTDIVLHPGYKKKRFRHDLAILQVKTPFVPSSEIGFIPLRFDPNPEKNLMCVVSGWGHTKFGGEISNDLLFIELPVIDQKICRLIVGLQKGKFCAGYMEGGKDACFGDSGGGLVCSGELTGLVSGGHECASPNYPGTYSDVGFHRSWILETVQAQKMGRSALFVRNSGETLNAGSIFRTFILAFCCFVSFFFVR